MLELGEVAAIFLRAIEQRLAIPIIGFSGEGEENFERASGDVGHFNSPVGGGHLGSQYNPYDGIDQKRKAKKTLLLKYIFNEGENGT